MTDIAKTQLPADSLDLTPGESGGKTVIETAVIAKIIGIAVREVPGVHALGGGVSRMMGAVRDAMGSTDLTQGVAVELGERQVAADITLVALYPYPLQSLADEVRLAAAGAITELIGLEPAEINVLIGDVHIPGTSDEAPAEPRVA